MAKFQKGDRVVALRKDEWKPAMDRGIVQEDDTIPYVQWEQGKGSGEWAELEERMVLAHVYEEILYRQFKL